VPYAGAPVHDASTLAARKARILATPDPDALLAERETELRFACVNRLAARTRHMG